MERILILGVQVHSFDDPALRKLRIGVQLIGDDGANTPPAHALAKRGIIDNVRGYTVYGDYSTDSPPARIIDAVAAGEIDIAVAWGPMAGYFARHASARLRVEPVRPAIDDAQWPMTYAIAMGVRKGQVKMKAEIEAILRKEQPAIMRILADYGVPLVSGSAQIAAGDAAH